MKAVVLGSPRGAITVESRDIPVPGPHEVLLRMEACGVCHSDLFVASLEKLPIAPVTLGHEGIGRVEAVGAEVVGWRAGDRAGMTFLATTCGGCELCTDGRERFCAKQTNFGFSMHGAMAEYAVAPASTLVRVPEGIAAAQIAPLCCAGWTAMGAISEAAVARGGSVALFGFGGLGHLALQIARSRELRVAVADISEGKLEQARAAGADFAGHAETASRALQKQWGGVDAAIVLAPSPVAVQQAFRSVKRTGTVVLVGISVNTYELPLVDTILKGIRIRGSYLGSRQELDAVFQMAMGGALRPQVTTYPIDEAPAVLDQLRCGEIHGRAVIAF